MVPTSITLIDEMPRMVSGKIDRGALTKLAEQVPAPRQASAAPSGTSTTAPGGDAVETAVQGIFEEVLASGSLGPDSDFFDEGGHSLLAIAVLDAIEKELGVSVDLGDFFLTPTVREVAELVRKAESEPRD
ncbi:phosphopantetheine-binding protein [Streptomyces flavofungini]|uniref:phosphopantetheine-binding protein n=1 Tax=Streptomyces flavofungini TaxID=68200 RepID=UPI0034E01FD5